MLEAVEPIDGGLFAGLLEEYAPKDDTFEVVLPRGEKLPFRKLYDAKEMTALQKEASEWAAALMPKKGKPPALIEGWEAVYTPDAGLLAQVFAVAKLALHPDLQSQLNVLTLARKCGPIFQSIVQQIDLAGVNAIGHNQADTVSEEKKDLPIRSTSPSPDAPGAPSADPTTT